MKQIIINTIFICIFCFAAFAQVPYADCPNISVTGPSSWPRPDEEVQFVAEMGKVAEKFNVEYLWTVSGGKIVSGNGSKTIKVIKDSTGVLTATVEVKGIPENCPNTASESTVHDGVEPVKQDELDFFGRSGTKGRLDALFIELSKDKTVEGIIVFPNDNDLLRKVKFLRNHIAFNRFPAARLTIVISAGSAQGLTEFWRVPIYGGMSQWEGELIIKLEDFEGLQKIFQPVKPKAKK